jgi:hypothetical protein
MEADGFADRLSGTVVDPTQALYRLLVHFDEMAFPLIWASWIPLRFNVMTTSPAAEKGTLPW